MWFAKNGTIFISMLGVPLEIKHILTKETIPKIKQRFETAAIYHQNLKTIGIPESELSELLAPIEDHLPKHIKLAYLSAMGQIRCG